MSNFDAFADFRMDGHVAIVTGGAQNIGEAIAKTFSGAGAKVNTSVWGKGLAL